MRLFKNILVGVIVLASVVTAGTALAPSPAQAKPCGADATFLGLPAWYRNLPKETVNGNCAIKIRADNNFRDIWTIVINIVDILLRLIGLVAVIFIIIGGVRYVISQGEPSALTAAKQTITRAIVGLVIAILSVLILNFIAGTVFKQNVNSDTYQVGG